MSNFIRDFIYRGPQQPGLPQRETSANAARFDVYGAMHKGVRESVQAALSALGSAEPVAGASLRAVIDHALIALDLTVAVDALEERHIHPVLDALCADLSRHACADHEDGRIAAQSLRSRLGALRGQPDGTDLAFSLHAVERDFAAFIADAICHMQRERRAHNPLLWLRETDAALRRLQAALLDTMRCRVPAEAYDMLLDQMRTPQGVAAAPLPRAA